MKNGNAFSVLILLCGGPAYAQQSYVPPPPPSLPKILSAEQVRKGGELFERSLLKEGPVEIYNYLGTKPCAACHDKESPLSGESLARGFSHLPGKINDEIVKRSGGQPLPPEGPAMDALLQYLAKRYRLYDYKISK